MNVIWCYKHVALELDSKQSDGSICEGQWKEDEESHPAAGRDIPAAEQKKNQISHEIMKQNLLC